MIGRKLPTHLGHGRIVSAEALPSMRQSTANSGNSGGYAFDLRLCGSYFVTSMSNGPQDRIALLKTRILIAAVVIGNVVGNALLSRGLHQPSTQLSPSVMHYFYAVANPWVIAGVLLLTAWMVANLSLLSRADLSYALPVTGSISYLLIALVGHFFLGEPVSL